MQPPSAAWLNSLSTCPTPSRMEPRQPCNIRKASVSFSRDILPYDMHGKGFWRLTDTRRKIVVEELDPACEVCHSIEGIGSKSLFFFSSFLVVSLFTAFILGFLRVRWSALGGGLMYSCSFLLLLLLFFSFLYLCFGFCLWEICFLLWLSLIFIFDRSLLSRGANSGWRCRLCAFSPRLWRPPTALCEIDLWKREISKDPGVCFVDLFFIFLFFPCVYATLFSKAWMYLSPIHEYKNSPLMRPCHVFLESF